MRSTDRSSDLDMVDYASLSCRRRWSGLCLLVIEVEFVFWFSVLAGYFLRLNYFDSLA